MTDDLDDDLDNDKLFTANVEMNASERKHFIAFAAVCVMVLYVFISAALWSSAGWAAGMLLSGCMLIDLGAAFTLGFVLFRVRR